MALAILASIGMNGLQHIVLERGRKLPRGC